MIWLIQQKEFVSNKQTPFCKAVLIWYYLPFQRKKQKETKPGIKVAPIKKSELQFLQSTPQILNVCSFQTHQLKPTASLNSELPPKIPVAGHCCTDSLENPLKDLKRLLKFLGFTHQK